MFFFGLFSPFVKTFDIYISYKLYACCSFKQMLDVQKPPTVSGPCNGGWDKIVNDRIKFFIRLSDVNREQKVVVVKNLFLYRIYIQFCNFINFQKAFDNV